MNTHKHTITLSRPQRILLKDIIRKGTHKARRILRAQALLASAGGATDEEIAHNTGAHSTTIERIRRNFAAGGMERALSETVRSGRPKKLDTRKEAYLIATACTEPPEGAHHWTLELLAERMVKDKKVKTISSVAIMHYLHQNDLKPWREKNVVHSQSHTRVHSPDGGAS